MRLAAQRIALVRAHELLHALRATVAAREEARVTLVPAEVRVDHGVHPVKREAFVREDALQIAHEERFRLALPQAPRVSQE